MNNSQHRIMITALGGGRGKTMVSLGLVAALRRMGKSVAPFKKGPYYIDANWLALAAGRPRYNLDSYMFPAEKSLESFRRNSAGNDISIIEGNRGLYDGMDAVGTHSSAELAKLLKCPVLLVVDCTKVTRTVAAMVLGAEKLDPDVPLAGVVLNQIASSRQEKVIREAIESACSTPIVGAIPRLKDSPLQDRHLGLVPPQEDPATEEALDWAANVAQEHLDLDRIQEIAANAGSLPESKDIEPVCPAATAETIRIGVIRDSVFQFYYSANLEALERAGAQIVQCNALKDNELPEIDALYIGGGFPETQAEGLAANDLFRNSIRAAADAGMPIYAECGGLMYLGEALEISGERHEMVGIFPVSFEVLKRPVGHGYAKIRVEKPNPFYEIGTELRGHEFHYSKVTGDSIAAGDFVFSLMRGHGFDGSGDGLAYKNVLALYMHIHSAGTPQWANSLAAKARAWRKTRSA